MEEMAKFRQKRHSFWSGLLNKKDGEIITPQPYFIYPLSKKHAPQMAFLSQEIYNHLKKEEQCFIHKKSPDFFEKIFDQSDITFIGVFHENKLIAMSYMRICEDRESFQEEIPNFSRQNFSNQIKVATFGGDCVHPSFRGNSLNQQMIEYRVEMAKEKNCQAVYAIIDRHNHWNMFPYFNNRFQMLSCGIDPTDGGEIAVMRYRQEQAQRIGNRVNAHVHQFEKIDQLIRNNFVGHTYNPQTREIMFVRSAQPIHIKSYKQLKNIRRLRDKIREMHHV